MRELCEHMLTMLILCLSGGLVIVTAGILFDLLIAPEQWDDVPDHNPDDDKKTSL